MKFNWGTGIFLFLVIFLLACAVFIIFASRQQVNLVHKNYYEKGVDYSEQMKVDARSKQYAHSLKVSSSSDFFSINIKESLTEKIDSGTILMFRPSDKTKDISAAVKAGTSTMQFDKRELVSGRYILKFSWYMDGLRYEINKPVNVQ